MDYQNVLVQEYTAYLESKDRFIERAFAINRFYMILVLILLFVTVTLKVFYIAKLLPLVILASASGMATSVLWWLNQDAYAYLSKIKLSTVLENFEQHLPVQPHSLEYKEIQKNKEKKKSVVFADIQKIIAFVSFMIFFSIFLYHGCVALIKLLSHTM